MLHGSIYLEISRILEKKKEEGRLEFPSLPLSPLVSAFRLDLDPCNIQI